MLYVIYNQRTDIDEVVTEELLDAIEDAGKIMDRTDEPDAYQALVIDLTEDSYSKHDWSYVSQYVRVRETLKGFINKYGINAVTASETKPKKETKLKKKDPDTEAWTKMNNTDNDYLKNLDEHEQLQVLHFIPDQMLIDELNRRIDEYRKYAEAIRDAGEELMIYV